jgi:ribA/ribD-fused uncharacterized protein
MAAPPDHLFFHSGSADRPPGQGANERVANPADYAELAQVPDWRKRLSNFWVADFTLDGLTYRTVEHAFQAAKIALVDAGKARSFTLESGSELARGGGLEARKQRKMVLLTPAQLAAWDAQKHRLMGAAMRAKFTQHPDLGRVLMATGEAELWHGTGRGQAPTRILDLEAVRADLRAVKG